MQTAERAYDIVITDMSMEDSGSGIRILEGAVARDVFTEVIVLTAYGNVANAVECMKRGAFDYVEKNMPGVDVYELLCLKVQQAVERRRSAVDTVRRLEAFTKSREQYLDRLDVETPTENSQSDSVELRRHDLKFRPRFCNPGTSPRAASGSSPTASAATPPRPSSGANTRRYHGLLVPAFSPPAGPRRPALQSWRRRCGSRTSFICCPPTSTPASSSRRASGT